MTARPPFRATLFVEHSRFDAVHPNQITQRRSQLLEASGVFGSETRSEGAVPVIDVKTLDASDKLRLRRDRGVGAGE